MLESGPNLPPVWRLRPDARGEAGMEARCVEHAAGGHLQSATALAGLQRSQKHGQLRWRLAGSAVNYSVLLHCLLVLTGLTSHHPTTPPLPFLGGPALPRAWKAKAEERLRCWTSPTREGQARSSNQEEEKRTRISLDVKGSDRKSEAQMVRKRKPKRVGEMAAIVGKASQSCSHTLPITKCNQLRSDHGHPGITCTHRSGPCSLLATSRPGRGGKSFSAL